jgi:hypothetical protein
MSFFTEHLQANFARVPNVEGCALPPVPCSRGDLLACWMTLLCVIDIQKKPRAVHCQGSTTYPQVKLTYKQILLQHLFFNHPLLSFAQVWF